MVVSEAAAESGGQAAAFLKKFRWSVEQQNEVALMIAEEKLPPEQAAEKWVERNEQVWKPWVG